MKNDILSIVNSWQIDGIWYIVPNQLSDNIFEYLMNYYPLECHQLKRRDIHIWFYDKNVLSINIDGLNISLSLKLLYNESAIELVTSNN